MATTQIMVSSHFALALFSPASAFSASTVGETEQIGDQRHGEYDGKKGAAYSGDTFGPRIPHYVIMWWFSKSKEHGFVEGDSRVRRQCLTYYQKSNGQHLLAICRLPIPVYCRRRFPLFPSRMRKNCCVEQEDYGNTMMTTARLAKAELQILASPTLRTRCL